MKSPSVTIRMKATEHYFPVVLFINLNKVVLAFGSVEYILKCDRLSNNNSVVVVQFVLFLI